MYIYNYRFGYNGEERMDEISGNGNVYDLGERYFDARLCRMFSTDPLEKEYPWQSPYAYCKNSPIWKIDYKGEGDKSETEKHTVKKGETLGQLANRLHTTIDEIKRLNKDNINWDSDKKRTGDKKDWIYEGETLNVPLKGSTPAKDSKTPIVIASNTEKAKREVAYKNTAQSGGGTDWVGIADATFGIIGGGLEVTAGVFGEVLTGGLSTIAIVDGVGRIGMNTMRLVAYSTGNSSVGKALPSNIGGMAGKIYDGAVLNKSFFESGPAQNVLGVSNDAAAFIFGGGSNISVILNPKTGWQLTRATSGYVLYHYDNFKPIWQNKK